jgi:Flp pilus assembly pilin Flp
VAGITLNGKSKTHHALLKLYVQLQAPKHSEEDQEPVKFASLVALIVPVCISGVSNVASAMNGVFSNISGSLA